MTRIRFEFLFWGAAVAAVAFLLLNTWSTRHAPMWKRFETAWGEDVELLEGSGRLPKAWGDVKSIELIGGTPESRAWLKLVRNPLKTNPDGKHRMDVLVVAWEEEGKRGALVQYNIAEIKSKNHVSEIGRTLILSLPPSPLEEWLFR